MCKKAVHKYRVGLAKRFSYDLLRNFLIFDITNISICQKEDFEKYG